MSLIAPHGGKLVNRVLSPEAAKSAAAEAKSLPQITLSPREAVRPGDDRHRRFLPPDRVHG